ncbi:flavin reductase family protein [Streptomyces sp. NBC_00080]|uniref:flavin reductase family protein n=1 Tax=Streptomyces sp. NBC_00080 TaxID=2975645 RepID=UPI00324A46EF
MPVSLTTSPHRQLPPVEAQRFRHVLGHVPTAVSVVTATTPEGPVGVTVGSLASVSLEPPLVVFYSGQHSASAAAIVSAGEFCVNVLAQDQGHVCAAFAGRTADRFASGSWDSAADGPPRLDGALAWIECTVEASFPAGDHIAVMGRVHRLAADDCSGPLVFCRGRLLRLEQTRTRDASVLPFDWWTG